MADQQIYTVEIDGRQYDLQGDHPPSEAEARSAIGSTSPAPAQSQQPTRAEPSSKGGLILAGAGHAVPATVRLAEEAATNPAMKTGGAAIGRVIGGLAPVVGGTLEGGPIGALAGVAAASKGAWAGGKTGWFTGKMLQDLSGPIAKVAAKAAPYAQAVNTVSGLQSLLDLAQMADPNRTDIGLMGIGYGDTRAPGDVHPALLNAIASRLLKIMKGEAR